MKRDRLVTMIVFSGAVAVILLCVDYFHGRFAWRHEEPPLKLEKLLWTEVFPPGEFISPGERRDYYHTHREEFQSTSEFERFEDIQEKIVDKIRAQRNRERNTRSQ